MSQDKINNKNPQHKFSKLLLPSSEDGIRQAADIITAGGLVAFPTETVYGLGANALNESAAISIFQAKGRPMTDPLIVHVTSLEQAKRLIDVDTLTSHIFEILAKRFWPGPLTIILKAAACVPSVITAGTGMVGIRSPSHPIAIRFIEACGLPIAAPSANRFGHVSPTLASHVLDDLGEKGVQVIDGDDSSINTIKPCEHGIESTVVKIDINSNRLLILRQGAVAKEQLESELRLHGLSLEVSPIIRTVKVPHNFKSKGASTETSDISDEDVNNVGQEAPGQLITHYAPDAPCYLLNSLKDMSGTLLSRSFHIPAEMRYCPSIDSAISMFNPINQLLAVDKLRNEAVIIDFAQQLSWVTPWCLAYTDLSSSGDVAEAARNLFFTLRWAENVHGASIILIAPIITAHVGTEHESLLPGLVDRIFRATSGVAVDIELANIH